MSKKPNPRITNAQRVSRLAVNFEQNVPRCGNCVWFKKLPQNCMCAKNAFSCEAGDLCDAWQDKVTGETLTGI